MDEFIFFSFWIWAMLVVIMASWVWFAFTKSKRVRWLLVSGWWIFGVLSAILRTSDGPFLIHIIAYPLGVVLASLCWAFVFRGLGWIGIRLWWGIKYIRDFFSVLAFICLGLCGCGDEIVVSRQVLEIVSASDAVVTSPPESVWDGIRLNQRGADLEAEQRAFYTKYIDAGGIAILSDARVADRYLIEARQVVLTMTSRYPALRDRLKVAHGFYLILFKPSTGYDDISHVPELFGTLGDYSTYREQGMCRQPFAFMADAGVKGYCTASVDDENFGRMRTLTHEFAHALDHEMERLSPGFFDRLGQAYQQAEVSDAYRNLWDPYIVAENLREYWAEGVVIWYYGIGEGREFETHEAFASVDPLLYELLSEWFYQGSFSRTPIPGIPQYDLMWDRD